MQTVRSTPSNSTWTSSCMLASMPSKPSASGRSPPVLSRRISPPSAGYFGRIIPTQIGNVHRQRIARPIQTRAANGGGNDGRIPPQEFIYKFLTEKQLKSVSSQVSPPPIHRTQSSCPVDCNSLGDCLILIKIER